MDRSRATDVHLGINQIPVHHGLLEDETSTADQAPTDAEPTGEALEEAPTSTTTSDGTTTTTPTEQPTDATTDSGTTTDGSTATTPTDSTSDTTSTP